MEVTDEAVDLADMDDLSMSILEPAPAQSQHVGNVTITINSKGEINVDQSALATILDSGQQSARVTFVRVGEEGATIENQVDLDASELLAAVGGHVDGGLPQEDGSVGTSPMLLLDQEQMMKLESVLQSDEAKNILGDSCEPTTDSINNVPSEMSEIKSKVQSGPMRRSQRQAERETRQTVEKIRAENQETMRKENTARDSPSSRGLSRGRGRGGMMRGGNRSRPKRQTRVPKHLENQELSSPKESEEEESDSDAGSWASEDDPDRLWCICQQPHNNRFMICCDICLDWFHGKCVGITKAQGKVMEEAGQDWKCPPCLAGLDATATEVTEEEEGNQTVEMDEILEDADEIEEQEPVDNDDYVPPTTSVSSPSKKLSPSTQSTRSRGRRKSSSGGSQDTEKIKEKVVTCHMCNNQPRESSIYCSEACIKAHANQALSLLTQDGKMSKASNPVVVLEPKTNTLLNGPNAPTEGSLQSWLQTHTSFHVVMPSKPSSSKFYGSGSQKIRTGPKLIAPHREAPSKKAQRLSFLESIQRQPIKSKEEMVAETKATLRRAISTHDSGRPAKKERRSSESTERRQPVVRKRIEKAKPEYIETKESKTEDSKSLRSIVVKGVRDSLFEKLEKCTNLKVDASKVMKIAEEIEIAMFGTFGEVGAKYKNKYRSLTYNIKDPKNDGLFRRILLRDLSPIEVVGMSADEYASKELQQWREQAAKKDIEAIKLHELDMLALGNTYVMKSHKGEQVIEKSDTVGEVAPSSSGPILPEEVPVVQDARGDGPNEVTWKHPNHGDLTTEPLCDVCNGKMSLEEFVSAKLNREGGGSGSKSKHHKEDRKRHSSSKSHSSSSRDRHRSSKSSSSSKKDRDKDRKHSSSSSKDKKHSSSSKSKHSSSSKEGDRHRSSSKKSNSNKEHKHSSSEKSSTKTSSNNKLSDDKSKDVSSSSRSLDASFAAASIADSEKAELQARINKATAAIEAAKNSGTGLLEQTHHSVETTDSAPEALLRSPELDLDLPDLDLEEVENRQHSSSADGEVTSTVTIATPEQCEPELSSQEPSVWEGQVVMPEVAKFSVSAYQVSGTSDHLRVDLKNSLALAGRIPPPVVWEYIDKISKNPTKEILVLRLGPSNNDEKEGYRAFFEYLSSRDRFGVVGNANKLVKDCYIMPLRSTSPVPSALLPLSGQGLPLTRPDLLLTIIVRTRRTASRPSDGLPRPPPTIIKPVEPLVPSLTDPENSPYSPPGSSPEYPLPVTGTVQEQPRTSSDSGGFTEKLARLQAEVAAKREELKRREAVMEKQQVVPPPSLPPSFIQPPNFPVFSTDVAQPNQSPNLAGGLSGSAPSSLSRLSDADLLAKAQSMEQRSLPPPGPGMPGNLQGQGVGNLQLQREEERGVWDRGVSRGFSGRGRDWDRQSDTWNNRRDFSDWDERDRDRREKDWRDRRGDRVDRGRREKEWSGADWRGRGPRRDYDRDSNRKRDRDRSRSRERNKDRESWRKDRNNASDYGNSEWDDEIRVEEPSRHSSNDFHRNVAATLADFDKQYLPP